MEAAALAGNKTYDIPVIGAGVFGAWTAYLLQRDGRRVILIDGYGAANSRSSSGDESRIIRMGYGPDEIYTRWALRALQLWKEFAAENKARIFHETGVLWLAHENDPYPVKTRETLARFGVPFETLTSDETARRYPQLGLENISWAMLEPESGVLSARRAVQAVVHAAIQAGAEFLPAAVTAPVGRQQLNYIVTETNERISAAAYVFDCRPWLPKLFPELLGDRIVPKI